MVDKRFIDNGETKYDFLNEILVVCPECQKCAHGFFNLGQPAKIVCRHCGFIREYSSYSYGKDSFCGTDLWLITNCCSEKLWAYNQEHLEFIERYVGATLRAQIPNINQSLANRLPKWMKKSSNRSEVLKSIKKLKEKLKTI